MKVRKLPYSQNWSRHLGEIVDCANHFRAYESQLDDQIGQVSVGLYSYFAIFLVFLNPINTSEILALSCFGEFPLTGWYIRLQRKTCHPLGYETNYQSITGSSNPEGPVPRSDGLIKEQKPKIPLRLNVASATSSNYKLVKYLFRLLRPFLTADDYSTKSSTTILE